jgi:hypothetical protein
MAPLLFCLQPFALQTSAAPYLNARPRRYKQSWVPQLCTLQQIKTVSAANRLSALLDSETKSLTDSEQKELNGLLRRDTYAEESFSPEHSQFKEDHNAIFANLAEYCGGAEACCFYLDGPAGQTTASLLQAGFPRSQLYTANWHSTTCEALQEAPQSLPHDHVVCCRAAEALRSGTGAFGSVCFHGLYIDGCSGLTRPLVDCIEALFCASRASLLPPRFAVGCTLTEAEPSGTPVADREVVVHRALAAACRRVGYRMCHVADEPWLYNADPRTPKKQGTTLTFWMVCTNEPRDVELGSTQPPPRPAPIPMPPPPSPPPSLWLPPLPTRNLGGPRAGTRQSASSRCSALKMIQKEEEGEGEEDTGASIAKPGGMGSMEAQIMAWLDTEGNEEDDMSDDGDDEDGWVWEGSEDEWEAAADEFEVNSDWLASAAREAESQTAASAGQEDMGLEVHPSAPEHARPLQETDEQIFIARAKKEEAYLGPGAELKICKTTRSSAADVVAAQGVARIPSALGKDTATRLHAHVMESFERTTAPPGTGSSAIPVTSAGGVGLEQQDEEDSQYGLIAVGSGTQRMSRLAMHSGEDAGAPTANAADAEANDEPEVEERRWDMRLPITHPLVRTALRELLLTPPTERGQAAAPSPLCAAFEALAGGDAELWETAAIMSAPGCPAQIVHADASWTPYPLLLTAFVALQPVSRDMGPTRFLPGTHTTAAPAAVVATGDATGLGAKSPPHSCVGLLDTGDAALYDGRMLHCGGANRSDKRRILFYLTFRSRKGRENGLDEDAMTLGRLLDELREEF